MTSFTFVYGVLFIKIRKYLVNEKDKDYKSHACLQRLYLAVWRSSKVANLFIVICDIVGVEMAGTTQNNIDALLLAVIMMVFMISSVFAAEVDAPNPISDYRSCLFGEGSIFSLNVISITRRALLSYIACKDPFTNQELHRLIASFIRHKPEETK
ncbi:hypothetical protein SUGI_0986500 [Cryptomeria japonica]|nr:hypothetical protein SUGI_0986500 [Cryptomeria japonica]